MALPDSTDTGPLEAGAVHVWHAALPLSETLHAALVETLMPEERARAARFRQPGDRARYEACRGIARSLLAAYTNRDHAELAFVAAEHGKPCVSGCPVRFNIAHCAGMGVFAFALDREVGVDVELADRRVEARRVANRYFSPAEIAQLNRVGEETYREAFLNGWTSKEAVIKAIGDGLRMPLRSFDVALTPGDTARLLAFNGDTQAAKHWTLEAFTPAPGFIAAVAVKAAGIAIRYRTYP